MTGILDSLFLLFPLLLSFSVPCSPCFFIFFLLSIFSVSSAFFSINFPSILCPLLCYSCLVSATFLSSVIFDCLISISWKSCLQSAWLLHVLSGSGANTTITACFTTVACLRSASSALTRLVEGRSVSSHTYHQLLHRSGRARLDNTCPLQWAPALLPSPVRVTAHFRRCSKVTDR